MTDPNTQHPWSKYYADRGIERPAVADLAPRRVAKPKSAEPKAAVPAMSQELQAAVAAVTAHVYVPGSTAAPFITAMQREAVAREMKRRARARYLRFAAVAAAVLVVFHFALINTVFRAPSDRSLQAHLRDLPAAVLELYSSGRQPMQAEKVVIAQADRIDGGNIRYVAAVTLRLRQDLHVPAATNGTLTYRRLQEALIAAQNQEMRYNLFPPAQGPELPELPLLLQRTHKAGEAIVVRVPFTARRLGWGWRLERPPVELRQANRNLDGDSLDRYAGTPYLIYGDPASLADIRQRVKQANNYVMAVAKAVQRKADVVAVAAAPVVEPVQPDDATLPADEGPALADGFDPNAPAIEEPANRKLADNQIAKPVFSARKVIVR